MCYVATFPTKILTRVEFGAILWMWNQISMRIKIHIFTYLVINYGKLEKNIIRLYSPNVTLCKDKNQVYTYSSLQKHSHQIFVYMWLHHALRHIQSTPRCIELQKNVKLSVIK